MNLQRIDRLFTFEKGFLQSTKCEAGEYDFITAAADWKTHKEYTHEGEYLIFAAAAAGSLGRTHYVNGKFVSSDLCFIITPKDEEKFPIDLQFYHIIFRELRNDIVARTKAGTSKEAISLGNFGKYELPYFPIEKQLEIKNSFVKAEVTRDNLSNELSHQLELVSRLRQAFLREAMQGKLVPQETADEPAAVLLEKIKAEKEKLIAEKKIKKQKPLPEIKPEEIPFEIPNNWTWCRLGDISEQITDGEHQTPPRISEGRMLLSAKNIRDGFIDYGNVDFISEEYYQKSIQRCKPEKGDILIVSVGATIGRSTVKNDDEEFAIVRSVALIKPFNLEFSKFFKFVLDSPILQKEISGRKWGTAQPCLYLNQIKELTIPLPPLAEQKRIVEKLEKLMKFCDELEANTKSSKENAETLLQVALKEALET